MIIQFLVRSLKFDKLDEFFSNDSSGFGHF